MFLAIEIFHWKIVTSEGLSTVRAMNYILRKSHLTNISVLDFEKVDEGQTFDEVQRMK